MAYQYWQLLGKRKKRTFLNLKNAYHGDTLGAVSVGGIGLFHKIFHPLLFKAYEADAPYRYRDAFQGSEEEYARAMAGKVEAVLKKNHESICALIWEPVMQGAAGMLKQPAGYGAYLRKITKKYNVLLIADEVATGFGRTGKMFACEHDNVSPDLFCVAKGITGGYLPLSATLTTETIYDAFLGDIAEFKAFFHGHTYSANPLACAAALANLKLFKKERTLEKLEQKIEVLSHELWKMRRLEHVGDIRQAGFMVGIELVKDTATKESYPVAEKRGIRVGVLARKHGVLIRPLGNVVVLMPPLSITVPELKKLCRVTRECIEEATET
jgi:adenosylmethionine-8-amino-7-oxononanoate aminotransferase